jgi:hypothetical protein
VLISSSVQAAFTDFSDYTQSETFQTDDVFHSNGLSFKAVELQIDPNPVRIISGSFGQGLLPGPGVEFLLPPGVQEVSLFYADGAGSAIAINGSGPITPSPHSYGFSFLNGMTIAGVDVSTSVVPNYPTNEAGILTLRGPINSLVIAGLELTLDDITVRVPEPVSAVMLIIGAAILLRGRQRLHA